VTTTVLLVNFGGPRTLDEVPLFLRSLTGRDVPRPVLEAVLERYRIIGGGSPLAAITEEQASLLTEQTGGRFAIRAAFRYSAPTLEEMINECYRSGVERMVFFIMSPFYTSRTAGSSIKAVEAYLAHLPYRPEVVFIHSWASESGLAECWAGRIRESAPPKDAFFLFSAHSLPMSLTGEPYRPQIEETVRAVAERLHLGDNYAIGWQSVPQNVEEPWIGPSVESAIDQAAKRASKVVEVPIGFVSDHLETLYDMDVVHRGYALSKGLSFTRTPSLNTYPPFIALLKTVLEKNLR
jgi:protoporphyrin/coproporphyrin ferrochelatase